MQILEICILIILGYLFFYFIAKEIIEVNFLKKTLFNIISKKNITTKQDLIKIKNFLNKNISYNPELKTKKRSLLRNTASQTLKSHYGFCGENVRVAIKLFKLGGIKARRIYLYREKWQHVLIEHEFKGKWYMFDGHYDPNAFLEDDAVTAIISENIHDYPNNHKNHPYINYCRIKLFYNIKPLRFLSKLKFPNILVYFFESPYLIKGLGIFILLGIILLILELY